MSGKATFHTKVARAINHIVTSKQYSSLDSAGSAPMKYRKTSNALPLPHRIYGLESTNQSAPEPEEDQMKSVNELCLFHLIFNHHITLYSSVSQFDDSDALPGVKSKFPFVSSIN